MGASDGTNQLAELSYESSFLSEVDDAANVEVVEKPERNTEIFIILPLCLDQVSKQKTREPSPWLYPSYELIPSCCLGKPIFPKYSIVYDLQFTRNSFPRKSMRYRDTS